jgi:1,4-dihydroxy-2-naphthoate octaprenyltransferase
LDDAVEMEDEVHAVDAWLWLLVVVVVVVVALVLLAAEWWWWWWLLLPDSVEDVDGFEMQPPVS